MITRESLLKPAERRYTNVTLPFRGERVRIQSLSERERSAYEAFFTTKTGTFKPDAIRMAKCKLAVLCIVDDAGNRILSDADTVALMEMDSGDINALWAGIREHCGFDEADLSELVKNSEPTTDSG